MHCTELNISQGHVHKLLCTGNGDAVLLYLYIQSGNQPETACDQLKLSESRYACAAAMLRQLGLWPEKKTAPIMGERPQYTETDVLQAMHTDNDFPSLRIEVEHQLGKTLTNEELKILLGFVRYLGLPSDVISVLICYCKNRAQQRGSNRNPSLRSIEKEAYAWAEQGIDTMEEAVAFIQNQNMRRSQTGRVMELLQIRGRNLLGVEERYVQKWLDLGISEQMISLAYERTCLNTGGLSWPYMNKILTGWHDAGVTTPEQANSYSTKNTRRPGKKQVPMSANGQLGAAELEAIQQLLQEE